MSKPTPVAWWCPDCKMADELFTGNKYGCPHCGCKKMSPLFPPSVVAGELKELSESLYRKAQRVGFHTANAYCHAADEAAERAEKWENR